jgi:DNA-binding transcriptional regulator LsrR (DeoR family)
MFPVDRNDHRRSSSRRTYEVKNLWQLHHEIIDLAMTGMKQTEIAAQLGCTSQTVSNTLNSTLAKEKMELLRGSRDMDAVYYQESLAELARKATEIYHEILDAEEGVSPALKVQVANTVLLDLAGLGAPKKVDVRTTTYTAQDVEQLKQRGLAAARACGILPPEPFTEAELVDAAKPRIVSTVQHPDSSNLN